jgi:hypothetical protein
MTDHDDLFARALAEAPVQLSHAGHARRAAIGAGLRAAARARRRRRLAVRAAAAVAVLLTAVVWWRGHGAADLPVPVRIAPAPDRIAATRVHDDPTVLARCTVRPALRGDVMIDDDELLALLEGAGRPTGLIRRPDGVVLTAQVFDPIGE